MPGVTLDAGALIALERDDRRDLVLLARALDATSVGRLLAASGTADIVDAHVVICARRAAQHVATSDSEGPLVLEPDLRVVRV